MPSKHASLIVSFCLSSCALIDLSAQQPVPENHRTIKVDGGGEVTYAPLSGAVSPHEGITFMLKQIKAKFGDAPLTPAFLKSRDEKSVASFFELTATNEPSGRVTGLIIVAKDLSGTLQSAVLYDTSEHFVSSEPAMLHALAEEWKKTAKSAPTDGSSNATLDELDPGPFHLVSGGDNSASICLPQDWMIVRVSSGGLSAKGSHGEVANLGFIQSAIDPTTPAGRVLAQSPSNGAPVVLKFPKEGDLFNTFTETINQLRARQKLDAVKFSLENSQKIQSSAGFAQSMEMTFTVDLLDGLGPRQGSARLDVFSSHAPQWFMMINSSSVPDDYANREKSTVLAIIRSYQVHEPAITGGHGDPGYWDDDRKSWVLGRKTPAPQDCSAIVIDSGPAGWAKRITEAYRLDGLTIETDGTPMAVSRFGVAVAKARPRQFELAPEGEFKFREDRPQ